MLVCHVLVAGCRRYAATVFAYGQTGSGKTHTMSGYEGAEGNDGQRVTVTHNGEERERACRTSSPYDIVHIVAVLVTW